MTIDVIIATYNRSQLLSKLLDSLRAAERPAGLRVRTIVVDNNSHDDTRAVVERFQRDWPETLEYRFEPRQSKSLALNNGLSVVDADVVGMLDDDEEVHPQWFAVIARTLADPTVDFMSGPYVPNWAGPIPRWLPPDYPGVIGWLDAGDRVLEYGKDYDGVMMGGNAVVRTAAGASVGWFNAALGRVGTQIGSGCEDVDFFERLLRSGCRGLYVPDLIIYHYIPEHRLTKRHYRRWCFRRQMAAAELNTLRKQSVRHVLGVPRYMIGTGIRSLVHLTTALARREWNTSATFSRELAIWELAGFVAGVISRRPATHA